MPLPIPMWTVIGVLLLALAGLVGYTRPASPQSIAAALAYARYAPLFDLTGTDPAELSEATRALKEQVDRVAAIQPGSDTVDIRDAYPVSFLLALAELEQARQQFLQSGSAADAATYDRLLGRAIARGRADIRTFIRAFEQISQSHPAPFTGFGGTIYPAQLLEAALDIEAGFAASAQVLQDRRACIRRGDCTLPPLPIPESADTPQRSRSTVPAASIRTLLAEAGLPTAGQLGVVELSHSTCLSILPPPYAMFIHEGVPNSSSPLRYAEDIFFYSTDYDTPMLNYLREDLGMRYYPTNPSTYYMCPDSADDAARARAIAATAAAAEAHGVALERSEEAAREYVRTTAPQASTTLKREFTPLALMFINKGAGLETVVWEITRTLHGKAQRHELGLPANADVASIFLTHTGFLSLFQHHNPSFGSAGLPVSEYKKDDAAAQLARTVRYSATAVPQSEILKDMRLFFTFERLGRLR